ncbi:hypothetical protein C4E44_34405 [Pseudomonas sp. MWU12-2312b]|nr:hypothetical protein C4E44_34405 [Pseudomonas sp. MWU12-2312b]
MTCLICGEPATVIDTDGDYDERACPSCGHYRITDTALILMDAHDWNFDVDLARKWISEHQSTRFIPTIDSHQAGRLIDV